jgi:molybdopterin converting factor subunit 1
MQVKVLFFGVLRDHFQASEQSIHLPGDTATVATLLTTLRQSSLAPQAESLWPALAVAVNCQYASHLQALQPGDEVALLPPVSGGAPKSPDSQAAPLPAVLITNAPLQADRALQQLKAGTDGAVIVFDGIVRNNTRGRHTQHLVYHAYEEMALSQMQALVVEAQQRFAVREILLHHRLGQLEVGETSVLIVVASAHRAAAFDACRWVIDTLKKTVPIWKKEFFIDGAVWADGEPFPPELQPGAPA